MLCIWSFALFSLPNNLLVANKVRGIYILINWLGLKELSLEHTSEIRTEIPTFGDKKTGGCTSSRDFIS